LSAKWSLRVKGFGKIKEAEIETAPFLLFVGDNNSGKSYLMSLLWGVLSQGRRYWGPGYFTKVLVHRPAYEKCEQWFKAKVNDRPDGFVIDEEGERLLVELFNDALDCYKDTLVQRVIHFQVPIEHLSIVHLKRSRKIEVKFLFSESQMEEDAEDPPLNRVFVRFDQHTVIFRASRLDTILSPLSFVIQTTGWHLLMEGIQSSGSLFSNLREPLFLPASRTGFMLTYKKVLQEITELGVGGEEEDREQMPMPYTVVRFLQKLIGLEYSEDATYAEVARYLEDTVIHGHFEKDESPIPSYEYVPEGSNRSVPIHAASSLVAELSPLILMLRSQYLFGLLIIEEPEAHLHPAVQRYLVRAIAKLIHAGLPVWITTHSDTIIQQVNNLICLNSLCNRVEDPISLVEFGYEKDETLEYQKVRMYQFSVQSPEESQVISLTTEPEGVTVPTFNETIIALQREVMLIQNELAAAIEQNGNPKLRGD